MSYSEADAFPDPEGMIDLDQSGTMFECTAGNLVMTYTQEGAPASSTISDVVGISCGMCFEPGCMGPGCSSNTFQYIPPVGSSVLQYGSNGICDFFLQQYVDLNIVQAI